MKIAGVFYYDARSKCDAILKTKKCLFLSLVFQMLVHVQTLIVKLIFCICLFLSSDFSLFTFAPLLCVNLVVCVSQKKPRAVKMFAVFSLFFNIVFFLLLRHFSGDCFGKKLPNYILRGCINTAS